MTIAAQKTPMLFLLAAVAALLALPAAAAAEYYVPPSNSAANQYTETVPSAGGNKGGKDKGGPATAAETLGSENAKRLEEEGPAGKAAAEIAAETAPAPESAVSTGSGNATGGGQGGNGGQGGGPSGGANPGGGSGGQDGGGSNPAATVEQPSGSSALGEIVRQATGSGDDGNLGLWLPLAIVAILGGSIAYGVRHRDRTV